MKKQAGQITVLLLLVVVLVASLWVYMRWTNHKALLSLSDTISYRDSSIERQDFIMGQLGEERKALVAALASESKRSAVEFGELKAQMQQQDALLSEQSAVLAGRAVTVENLQQQLLEKNSGIDSLLEDKQKLTAEIESMTVKLVAGNAELAVLTEERDIIAGQVISQERQLKALNQSSEQLNQRFARVNQQLASEKARSQAYSQKIETLEEQYAREQAALRALELQINQFREGELSRQAVNTSLGKNDRSLNDQKRQVIQQFDNGISVIRIPDRILFDTGSAELNKQGKETLALVAQTLEEFPDHLISVEGHTDHRSIGPLLAGRYPSNWELSSARAASAIRVLVGKGISSTQFQLVGLADTRPLVDNTQSQRLSVNRRIEILLLPPTERQQKIINLIK